MAKALESELGRLMARKRSRRIMELEAALDPPQQPAGPQQPQQPAGAGGAQGHAGNGDVVMGEAGAGAMEGVEGAQGAGAAAAAAPAGALPEVKLEHPQQQQHAAAAASTSAGAGVAKRELGPAAQPHAVLLPPQALAGAGAGPQLATRPPVPGFAPPLDGGAGARGAIMLELRKLRLQALQARLRQEVRACARACACACVRAGACVPARGVGACAWACVATTGLNCGKLCPLFQHPLPPTPAPPTLPLHCPAHPSPPLPHPPATTAPPPPPLTP